MVTLHFMHPFYFMQHLGLSEVNTCNSLSKVRCVVVSAFFVFLTVGKRRKKKDLGFPFFVGFMQDKKKHTKKNNNKKWKRIEKLHYKLAIHNVNYAIIIQKKDGFKVEMQNQKDKSIKTTLYELKQSIICDDTVNDNTSKVAHAFFLLCVCVCVSVGVCVCLYRKHNSKHNFNNPFFQHRLLFKIKTSIV